MARPGLPSLADERRHPGLDNAVTLGGVDIGGRGAGFRRPARGQRGGFGNGERGGAFPTATAATGLDAGAAKQLRDGTGGGTHDLAGRNAHDFFSARSLRWLAIFPAISNQIMCSGMTVGLTAFPRCAVPSINSRMHIIA